MLKRTLKEMIRRHTLHKQRLEEQALKKNAKDEDSTDAESVESAGEGDAEEKDQELAERLALGVGDDDGDPNAEIVKMIREPRPQA